MTHYGFFRSIRFLIGLGCLAVIVGLFYVGLIFGLCSEIYSELSFKHRYGAEWRVQYEQTRGCTVAKGQTNMVVGALAIAGMTASGIMLVRGLKNGGRGTPKKHHSNESRIERRVRYKRNALLGVYFGVPGILLSVLLAIFRWGIFADHSDEVILAIFIFISSYCAVVSGCYWWLRLKKWTEAVLIIAFMPLIVFFIPFVRLVVFKAIGLLIGTMVMMPLILVVVVAVLPDKSGHQRRRATWER